MGLTLKEKKFAHWVMGTLKFLSLAAFLSKVRPVICIKVRQVTVLGCRSFYLEKRPSAKNL